jgi:hypothetical protein
VSEATAPRTQDEKPVPLKGSADPGPAEAGPNGWAAEEAVPVRIAAERAEAEERAERLRLVTGRRRSRWR